MYCILSLFIGLSYISIGHTYVLLQVRKHDNNHSNVDALIHKVVSSDRVDQIANKIARKQFSQANERPMIDNNLDNVVLAIDTGAVKEPRRNTAIDLVDTIVKTVSNFASSQPGFRSQEYLKPEIVNFRADKPSVMFEINSKSIIKALKDVLSSKSVAKYVDKITKEAAMVYRTLQDEFKKN